MAVGLFMLGASGGTALATSFADVAFVVDQSGSMGDEFAWLSNSISAIDQGLGDGGVITNYALAGYEEDAGFENSLNAWQDMTPDINDIITGANYARSHLYGGHERGYHAAQWGGENFSWTGGNHVKVMVLITDEDGNQGSGISESDLGTYMTSNNVLLNVITGNHLFSDWDEAVYSTTGGYTGLFDLDYLNNDPQGFTDDFVAAKLQEIQDVAEPQGVNSIPEPTTMLLFGTGIIGLAGLSRKKLFQKN